ncbi:hypothetical protein EV122DRAFT_251141 [Schizophyllum commune]
MQFSTVLSLLVLAVTSAQAMPVYVGMMPPLSFKGEAAAVVDRSGRDWDNDLRSMIDVLSRRTQDYALPRPRAFRYRLRWLNSHHAGLTDLCTLDHALTIHDLTTSSTLSSRAPSSTLPARPHPRVLIYSRFNNAFMLSTFNTLSIGSQSQRAVVANSVGAKRDCGLPEDSKRAIEIALKLSPEMRPTAFATEWLGR